MVLFISVKVFPDLEICKSISALVNNGIRCKLVDHPADGNLTVLSSGIASL